MTRAPAFAGSFYEGTRSSLEAQVERYVDEGLKKQDAKAVLSPHAGLMYSGPVAGQVYSSIKFPETFVLLGPNHTGMGTMMSMMLEGRWEIPTATFSVDEALAASILERCPGIKSDAQAHAFEHSLEVQLPFIARFSPGVKIVPICVLSGSIDELMATGQGIAGAIAGAARPVVIVASSDMSHFIPDRLARQKDRLAIDRVLALDPEGLYRTVLSHDISMCGYMPTVIMLSAARALGATEATLVKYTTSAEVSGEYDSVVGYAGIVIK